MLCSVSFHLRPSPGALPPCRARRSRQMHRIALQRHGRAGACSVSSLRGIASSTSSVATQLLTFVSQKLSTGGRDEAFQVLEHGASLVRSQTGDSDDTAAVLLVTGILDTHREKWKEAAAAYEDAAKTAKSKDIAIAAMCSLAAVHAAKMDHPAAIAAATDAVRTADGAGTAAAKAAATGALGIALHGAGKFKPAENEFGSLSEFALALASAQLPPVAAAAVADALRGAGAWRQSHGDGAEAANRWYAAAHMACRGAVDAGGAGATAADIAGKMLAQDVLINTYAAMGQLSLISGDLDAAERSFGDALHNAEVFGGPASVSVGLSLALSADVYMARAAAAAMQQGGSGDAGGVLISEGLYRKAFSILGITLASQTVGPSKHFLTGPLEALFKARYGQVLHIAGPMRRVEAARWTKEALDGAVDQRTHPWPAGETDLLRNARPWVKSGGGGDSGAGGAAVTGGGGELGLAVVDLRLRAALMGGSSRQDGAAASPPSS